MSVRFTTRVALLAACALLCTPVAASAHGDAASHYLETGALYPSFAAQPSQAVELQLLGLLDAAQRAHYPLKVALLGDESDVIDMPEMLRRPQAYAEYVVEQLEGVRVAVNAPVLVVSPSGLGLAGPKPPGALAGIRPAAGATGDELARAAQAAVRRLATAAGHPLPASVPPAEVPLVAPASTPGSGYGLGGLTPFVVFAAIFGSALALYEGRTRLARRRRGRIAPTGEAA